MGNPERGWVAKEVDLEHGRWEDNSRSPEEWNCSHGNHILGVGTHRGVTMGMVITVEKTDITVGTMVVTVEEEWFITVVGAWWGGFALQGGQTQPPRSTREYLDLRAGPGSPVQVEWTHLLQRHRGGSGVKMDIYAYK